MPVGSRSRLEGDDAAIGMPSAVRGKEGVDSDIAGEPVCGSDHRGCGTYSCNFHDVLPNIFVAVTERTPEEFSPPEPDSILSRR
jgi:hypothetical protein